MGLWKYKVDIRTMTNIQEIYTYEIELNDGSIMKSGNVTGNVARVSFIPKLSVFPRHDIIFTDFKFKKRFQRTFIKPTTGIKESLHCVITDKFRFYLFSSSGRTLITDKDYDLYL